jgi:hypothetical protein
MRRITFAANVAKLPQPTPLECGNNMLQFAGRGRCRETSRCSSFSLAANN